MECGGLGYGYNDAVLNHQGISGLSAEQFKQVAPLATARSYQYRVRSFGYSMAHGTFCVLEAIIDLAGSEPRIVYLRDLTRLGAPLPVTSPER